MKVFPFHHPDFCPKVTLRRTRQEFLETLDLLCQVILTRGRAFAWISTYPSDASYRSAFYRLKKQGLIVSHPGEGARPILSLTPKGESALSDIHRPHRRWDAGWHGIWYLLLYDVPEEDRRYRDTLRQFLKRLRMGCLQKSAWITPRDIRPEFSDLEDASHIKRYALLLEARTVLGMRTGDIVRAAWNMDGLFDAQEWFVTTCERLLEEQASRPPASEEALTLGREELNAYRAVMELDPLLPRELWPPGYAGERVYNLHRTFHRAIARRI